MALFGKRRHVPQPDLMTLTPRRLVQCRVGEQGLREVLLPKFSQSRWGRFLAWLFGGRPNTVVHLDQLGSYVWELVDGERTVQEIASKAREHFGEAIEPVHERVGAFLTVLVRAEAIAFVDTVSGDEK